MITYNISIHHFLGSGGTCWISNTIPGVVTVHVPVGMIIAFNIIAISVTMAAIQRAKEVSYFWIIGSVY
jgi:hypothetical protein